MLDLVLWSWLLALTPWSLGLARKLSKTFGDPSRHGNGQESSCDPMII